MPFDTFPQQLDELRIHEAIIVGNVEDVDRLGVKVVPKSLDQTGAMLHFHHEDPVRPGDIREGDLAGRLGAEAAGPDGETGIVTENSFGGWATPLVPRADKQDREAGHGKILRGHGAKSEWGVCGVRQAPADRGQSA